MLCCLVAAQTDETNHLGSHLVVTQLVTALTASLGLTLVLTELLGFAT